MFKLVEDWKLSTLTKSEFSTLNNITYHSFNYWIKKYYKIQGTPMTATTSDDASLSFFNIPKAINPSKKQTSEKPQIWREEYAALLCAVAFLCLIFSTI
ncbi:MAG: hypothetical protein IPN09_16775 [Bacteroidetes bacterium]|nr:hypothetical protein [Bacteroidota bacterium]